MQKKKEVDGRTDKLIINLPLFFLFSHLLPVSLSLRTLSDLLAGDVLEHTSNLQQTT